MIAYDLILIPSILVVLAAASWVLPFINVPGYLKILEWIGRKSTNAEKLTELNKKLEALSFPVSAETFAAGRLVITLIPLIVGGVFLFTRPAMSGIIVMLLAPVLWRMPHHLLMYRENARKEELEREFSYMVSQVRIYSKASDHYQALKIVPYTLREGPLKKELQNLSAELEMTDINEAMENFSARCGFQPAKDFAQVLLVAIRTGIDVNQILSNFAKVTRQKRVNKFKRWIKIQPIFISVFPALLLMVFLMMWIVPMYTNIITRLQAIN